MKRHPLLLAPLALWACLAQAASTATKPPAEYAGYVAAVRKADTIQDPLQRCLAYPDLPGNTWPAGVAKARCLRFQTRSKYSIEGVVALLDQPDGAKTLDAYFQSLQDDPPADPALRERIDAAFSAFRYRESDVAERAARKWLAAIPDSPFAHTALGIVFAARGWDARGTKLIKDTPPKQLEAMTGHFVDAAREFSTALQARPELIPACVGLMEIGRQSSDELQAAATARCLDADPASFSVIEEMMTAAEPRWGGSDAQMRAVAAYALARVDVDPLLVLFKFDHAYYPIHRMTDGDDQAIAVLEPAALQVPNASYLREVGGAYLRRGDDWKAFAYLSQALRFMPDYPQESRYRAHLLTVLGEPAWARADAERAVSQDPESGWGHQILGNVVRALEGAAAAIPYYERAMHDSSVREAAFNDYCGALIDASKDAEAGKCLDELLAGYPENAEGWRQRVVLIGYDAPGSVEAMERFMALRDRDDQGLAPWANMFAVVLAAKKGTATPSELFDSRIIRAQAAERSTAGHAYQQRVQTETMAMLKGIFEACKPSLTSGVPLEFAAVMDIQPGGELRNVAVRPLNAWSTCFAKQFESTGRMPAPPEGYAPAGYPMAYQPRFETRTTTKTSMSKP